MNTPDKSILLVQAHEVLNLGLENYLLLSGLRLARCFRTNRLREAKQLIEEKKPDMVIVDPFMVEGQGLELLRRLNRQRPQTLMVAYGHHFSLEDIQHCLEAGASAVIAHTTEDAALVNAIVGVFAGQRHLLLTQGKTPFERLCQQWRIRPERLAKLSPQQQCVLQFLGSGLPMKEIARQMNISSRTVETYEQRLKETLGLTCNTALRRTAILHHALDEFLQQSTTTAHLPPMAKTGSVMKNASS